MFTPSRRAIVAIVVAVLLAGCATQADPYVRQSELRELAVAHNSSAQELRELRADADRVRETVAALGSLPEWRDKAQKALETLLAYLGMLDRRMQRLNDDLLAQKAETDALRRNYGRIEIVQLSSGEEVVVARRAAAR
jgi:parvulin-like peptidyl-prolyl isomerase